MKVYQETNLSNFEAWCGARDTKLVIMEHRKEEEFEALIEESYPDGIDETQLNDILWFDSEWVFECLGINEEEDDEDFD